MESAAAALARCWRGLARVERWAWGAWVLGTLGITLHVWFKPHRAITHVYRAGSEHWWSGTPLYESGIHGFLYLPSSAVLYTPMAWLPPAWGDVVWRGLQVAVLLWGVVRLARVVVPEASRTAVAWALLLALPAAGINILRAQTELIMLALMFHATVDMVRYRHNLAALSLTLAVAIKPIALVLWLLALVLHRPLRWPLLLGLVLVLGLPFLHPDPGYVVAQYQALAGKMLAAAQPDSGRWYDLSTLLRSLGAAPSDRLMTGLRAVAALVTLFLTALALNRRPRGEAVVLGLGFALCYLFLFNPRTEEGSALNLALLAGLLAARAFLVQGDRRGGWLLVVVCLGLGNHMYSDLIYRPTSPWLKPLLALVLWGHLAARLGPARPAGQAGCEPQHLDFPGEIGHKPEP